MASVSFTGNLQRHVATPGAEIDASTVRQALDRYFEAHPAARAYVLDDQGAVRKHMLILVDGIPVRDRKKLSDEIRSDSEVHVFQALTGG